jgi:ribonuclease P protein component
VAGRVVGKAVQRNRAKRRLREAVRADLPNLADGWDLVFTARPALVVAPFVQVRDAVRQVLQRAQVWSSP